jgi:hypothetical protein
MKEGFFKVSGHRQTGTPDNRLVLGVAPMSEKLLYIPSGEQPKTGAKAGTKKANVGENVVDTLKAGASVAQTSVRVRETLAGTGTTKADKIKTAVALATGAGSLLAVGAPLISKVFAWVDSSRADREELREKRTVGLRRTQANLARRATKLRGKTKPEQEAKPEWRPTHTLCDEEQGICEEVALSTENGNIAVRNRAGMIYSQCSVETNGEIRCKREKRILVGKKKTH